MTSPSSAGRRACPVLQALPINGKIVLRPPKAQTEEPAAKATERRPARRDK